MALRSLSRAGMGIGGRLAPKGGRSVVGATSGSRHAAGTEQHMSSFVGQGQGRFGDSQPPSYRQGSIGSGTQLFKLVETDLMSKELTRYGPSDAEHLGLHSIQDVLSDIAAATLAPRQATSSAEVIPVSAAPQKVAEAPAVLEEEVLAACGLGPVVTETEDVKGKHAPTVEIGEEGVSSEKMAIKRTYQPSTLKRKRKHGFLYRAKTRLGKKIMQRRQDKGRWRLGI